MPDAPMKRSQMLAVENVRRIAETLREERNNLMVIAQEQRELLAHALTLLLELQAIATSEQNARIGDLKRQIQAL